MTTEAATRHYGHWWGSEMERVRDAFQGTSPRERWCLVMGGNFSDVAVWQHAGSYYIYLRPRPPRYTAIRLPTLQALRTELLVLRLQGYTVPRTAWPRLGTELAP